MSVQLSDVLKDVAAGDKVTHAIGNYKRRYVGDKREGLEERRRDYQNFVNTYYDLTCVENAELLRLGVGRSRPVGNIYTNVLFPRPKTGVVQLHSHPA